MENIILIGMPGSGKSTVGVILAKLLGYGFVDSDLIIQEQEKKLLCQIMDERGIDGFIRLEDQVNSKLNVSHCVIATGGSVVYGSQAMDHLKQIGRVVYLKLSYRSLSARLGNLKNRGVVLRDGQTLKQLYDERIPLYERYADITVDEEGLDIEQTIERIMIRLETGENH